jgi:hypothetical protein
MSVKTAVSHCAAAGILLATFPLAAAPGVTDDSACPNIAGFMVIGELEHVNIMPEDLRLKARIDTGAQTSSIGVSSVRSFERDGKKWLHFSVEGPDGKKLMDFEKPVLRTAKIKRHGAEAIERPVVKLKIMLGNKEMEREFTLADRAQYKFPVLIGRNVLAGKYLVDVNRKFSGQRAGEKEE